MFCPVGQVLPDFGGGTVEHAWIKNIFFTISFEANRVGDARFFDAGNRTEHRLASTGVSRRMSYLTD
jgi:hypothetical protein